MRGKQTVAGIAVILASISCSSPASPDQPVPIPLTRLQQGAPYLTGRAYDQPATFVIRDRETWQSTWARIYRDTSPVPPLPVIDFSTEMVVGAALGAKPTSGYSVEFTAASEANGVVTVEARSISPGPNCVTLQVITYPLDLARMPRRDGTITFRFVPDVVSCR